MTFKEEALTESIYMYIHPSSCGSKRRGVGGREKLGAGGRGREGKGGGGT